MNHYAVHLELTQYCRLIYSNKKKRTCNHSFLIGSAVHNAYVVIMIQTLIIDIIKSKIKFKGGDKEGEVEALNFHPL